jgi:hypothetical protein
MGVRQWVDMAILATAIGFMFSTCWALDRVMQLRRRVRTLEALLRTAEGRNRKRER